jgi:CheY-like chemotaxis protein
MNRNILIADDDRLVRESLSDVFTGLGISTRQVANGGGAIEVLKRDRYDLLLSDVDMPDMTGFQLLSWVMAHPPSLPTVLMSARADGQLDRAAHQAGAVALLAKPVAITSLTDLLHRLFAL